MKPMTMPKHMAMWAALAIAPLTILAADKGEYVSAGGYRAHRLNVDNDCGWSSYSHERADCFRVVAALLPPLDPSRREEFGESYDPQKYLNCSLEKGYVAECDLYRLRRKPHPEYWPNPSLPRPVIPDGDKKVYRPGMSSEEYFKALCEAEAGEFIYKTVEDVEAVYQIRPRTESGRHESQDRYVIEAPVFYEGHTSNAERVFQGVMATQYPIMEKPNLSAKSQLQAPPYLRYERYERKRAYDGRDYSIPLAPTPASDLHSRYGFYWYGIKRPMDRELAVAGGEMVVVDLKTNEVLAVKRGFALAVTKNWGKGYSPTGLSWNAGGVCPASGKTPYPYLAVPFADRNFVNKVLKPKKTTIEGGSK